eukprot:2906368-Pleurochrysis_carterae.AAC.1
MKKRWATTYMKHANIHLVISVEITCRASAALCNSVGPRTPSTPAAAGAPQHRHGSREPAGTVRESECEMCPTHRQRPQVAKGKCRGCQGEACVAALRTVAGCALQHTRHRLSAMCHQGRALRAGAQARCGTSV